MYRFGTVLPPWVLTDMKLDAAHPLAVPGQPVFLKLPDKRKFLCIKGLDFTNRLCNRFTVCTSLSSLHLFHPKSFIKRMMTYPQHTHTTYHTHTSHTHIKHTHRPNKQTHEHTYTRTPHTHTRTQCLVKSCLPLVSTGLGSCRGHLHGQEEGHEAPRLQERVPRGQQGQ